jgi:hypothetical protein
MSGYLAIEGPPFFFCHGHHLTDPAAVILVLMIPGKGITGHGSGPFFWCLFGAYEHQNRPKQIKAEK